MRSLGHTLAALCALGLLHCADDGPQGPVQPTPDAGRYTGPIDPCEVTVPLDDGPPDPQSFVETSPDVVLPATREGARWPYTAQIPGSSADMVLSGVLPDGLTLLGGVLSGSVTPGSSDGDRARIHTFEVASDPPETAPIEVQIAVYPSGLVRATPDLPRYHEPGPHPIWNTQPTPLCPQNPVVPEVGPLTDVDLYMVYPTEGDPTQTGAGPVAPGRWPVVIFAHANNDRVCDINEKYLSLHDHWASWGFIVVAVDGTFLNCAQGTRENIVLRAEGQSRAIDTLEALHNDPESRFFGHIDLDRIVLAGHSRGGGASLVAANTEPRVRAVIDLQGVDLTSFGFGTAPLRPFPVLGMTAGEDVDLNYPIVEPTEDQVSGPYTWVNINGGIHAFTADTAPLEPDDVPFITQQQQHDITELFSTAFLARYVGVGDGSAPTRAAPDPRADAILFGHTGAQQVLDAISPLGVSVRWNRRMGGLFIDGFGGLEDPSPLLVNRLGGENVFEGFSSAASVLTYLPDGGTARRRVYEKSVSLRLIAGEGVGVFRAFLAPDRTGVRVDGDALLQARIKGPDGGRAGVFEVEVETTGGSVVVDGALFVGPLGVGDRFAQMSIPLGSIGIEPGEMVSVAFHLNSGVLFIDDLRLD